MFDEDSSISNSDDESPTDDGPADNDRQPTARTRFTTVDLVGMAKTILQDFLSSSYEAGELAGAGLSLEPYVDGSTTTERGTDCQEATI